MKKAIVTALTNKAKEAEALHRRAAMAERYGQAAYHQGLRDGLVAAAAAIDAIDGGGEGQPSTDDTAVS